MKTLFRSKFFALRTQFGLFALCLFLTACGGGGGGAAPQPPATTKAITAFSILGVAAAINETQKTISLTLPHSVSPGLLPTMIASFATNGASVAVGAVPQVSAVTPNDFSANVFYTVTAADGSVATYTVVVRIALNIDKSITDFVLNGVSGSVDEAHKTIGVVMPAGYPLTSLVATFSTTGSRVSIGAVQQASGAAGTPNNFSTSAVTPVIYTVQATDGSITNYSVYVRTALPTEKSITEFVLAGVYGVIDEVNKTISVTMPFGTNVTPLVADFSTAAAGVAAASGVPAVAVSGVPQTSQQTVNDFTNSLAYVVTPASGTPMTYTVSARVAGVAENALTRFALDGITGTITGNNIAVVMPFGYPLTNLVATYLTTGTAVSISTAPQTTGITSNDYTLPVVYTVAAANGTTANYTVTVSNALNTDSKITEFSLNGMPGVITHPSVGKNGRIEVTVPRGTNLDLSSVTAHYATSGSRVHLANVTQISGFTSNALVTTKPLTYTVDSVLGGLNYSLYDLSHYESTCDTSAQPPYVVLGNYRLFNNPWGQGSVLGSQFTECMNWNPAPAVLANWSWNWPFTANSGGVITQPLRAYPAIQYRPADAPPSIALSAVSATTTLKHNVVVTDTTATASNLLAPVTVPPTPNAVGSLGDYNVAYDIWLDSPQTRNTGCYKAEMMIKLAGTWEDAPLFMDPVGLPLQLTVTDTVSAAVYTFNVAVGTMNIGSCSWYFYSFMGYTVPPSVALNNPTLLSSASLPVQAFINYLTTNATAITTAAQATMHPVGSALALQLDITPVALTDVITGIEFGTEIVQGAGNITVNSFSVQP